MIILKSAKKLYHEYWATGTWSLPVSFFASQVVEVVKIAFVASLLAAFFDFLDPFVGLGFVIICGIIMGLRPYFYVWSILGLIPALGIVKYGINKPHPIFFFGTFAILVAIAIFFHPIQKRLRKKLADQFLAERAAGERVAAAEAARHKTCPHCAETILAEAKVCKHCGRDI